MRETVKAKISVRTGGNWLPKPEALTDNGEVIDVYEGWKIESGMYEGEIAWVVVDKDYPLLWIASGDLEFV